jgi:hypothetical protein
MPTMLQRPPTLTLLAACLLLGCKPAEPPPATGTPPRTEAEAQLAKLYEGASAYYDEPQATAEGPAPRHQCPTDGRATGAAGLTPPLSVRCAKGPDGRCVPGGSGPGGYPASAWTDNPVWNALGVEISDPHRFHYDFLWANTEGRFGPSCVFTVQAFADLDNDGVYSTYERSGFGGDEGIESIVGMYLDKEFE